MPIKTYRPVTPTLRFQTTLVNDDITTDKPHKPLLVSKQRTGGRRNAGDLTMRHHGGGHKKKLRLIDFKREKFGVPGKVATIEYDPNRSSRIALIH
jgi:large subunit ribosomal protein L2